MHSRRAVPLPLPPLLLLLNVFMARPRRNDPSSHRCKELFRVRSASFSSS